MTRSERSARVQEAQAMGSTLTLQHAERLLASWGTSPRPLARPVLLVSGYFAPDLWMRPLEMRLRQVAACPPGWVHRIRLPLTHSLPLLGARLAHRFGWLAEQHDGVDVVGYSMGGIVAREAARRSVAPRLPVRRLYTLATPHTGACRRAAFALHQQARWLVPWSRYLRELNADPRSQDFPVETYSLSDDHVVPPWNAHAVGELHVHWPRASRLSGHVSILLDPRVAACVLGSLLGYTVLPARASAAERVG